MSPDPTYKTTDDYDPDSDEDEFPLEDHDFEWSEEEAEFMDELGDDLDPDDPDDASALEHVAQEDLSRKAQEILDENYDAIFALGERLSGTPYDDEDEPTHEDPEAFARLVTYFTAKGFTVVPDTDLNLGGWSHGTRGPEFYQGKISLPEGPPGYGDTTEVESICLALIMLGLHEERSLDEIEQEIKECKGLQALAHAEETEEQDG